VSDALTDESIPNVAAKGVPIQVVAVKRDGHWIIRAIASFRTVETLTSWIQPYLALAEGPHEWSQHEYHLPAYLAYGGGDLKPMGWPDAGVFLFPHLGQGAYGSAEKLRGAP
jgi:hypothetical protein